MPKNVPEFPGGFRPPSLAHTAPPHEFELVTPLFGGGAEARVNDPTQPVSAKAVRGHLRFWWRATRGRVFANPADLWQREEEIFGSTEFASPLRVSVEADPRPPQFASKNDFRQGTPEGYALFALQPGDRVIREGLKFRLTLTWAGAEQLTRQRAAQNRSREKAKQPPLPGTIVDIGDDLDVALCAWANLGGIGGRTRRGCGALRCNKLAPVSAADVPNWFRALEARVGAPTRGPALWPILSAQRAYLPTEQAAVSAWLHAMTLFRDFRQGVGVGRDRGRQPNRPGRSRFPEPETIREALNRGRQRPPGQHPRQPHIPADAFPRAEFGLPIVFHFQNNEVSDTVLYPRVGKEQPERMASPLVLKPLCLANGKAVPLAVRLDGPRFTAVELTQRGRQNVVGVPHPPTAVRRPNLATYTDSPLAGAPSGSALEAFLNFLAANGFTGC